MRRRSARSEGGVAARPCVGVISNSPIRTSLSQTVSMGGDQGGSTWETANELDSGDRVMARHLSWWTTPYALETGVEFRLPPHQETVFMDASLEGWGIVCQGQSWGGRWQRQGQHINWLELRTVLIALQLLQFRLRNKPVLFLIDNSTAVSHLKKQGGTRSRSLLKLTTRILQLAHDLGIQILPRHITGQLNVLADLASRSGQIVPSEWALSPQAFQWVVS